MATYFPPKRATAFVFGVSLPSYASSGLMQSTPTLAAGDVKISKDGGALANLTTLPTVTPAAGKRVEVSLSATEATADNVTVIFSDQTVPPEWCDVVIHLQPTARQIDDLAYPATSGRSMVVDAAGLVDANAVKIGPTGSGTAQTARDVGASVLLSTGTGTGQLDFTAGVLKANAVQWLGGTIPAVNVTGVPLIDLKYTLGTISPATAGSVRADAVTGAVGSVTGAVGSVTGAVGSVTGNVGGNVTGSVGSVTGLTASNLDATISSRLAGASYTAPPSAASNASAVWEEALAGHTTVGSAGKTLSSAGAAGDPWSTALPGAYGAGTAGKLLSDTNVLVNFYLDASSYSGGQTIVQALDAIKAKTTSLTFTVPNQADVNIKSVAGTTVTGNGSAGTPWGP